MALRQVYQVHVNGCFIAALAMLLGKTYEEALKLVHPNARVTDCSIEDFRSNFIGDAASEVLTKQGCKVKKVSYKKLKSLLKYAKKNVLLIIRWGGGYICHAVVFDVETKKFLDPSSGELLPHNLRSYQRQIDSMYYVDTPKAA
jgi:hypothetical protein